MWGPNTILAGIGQTTGVTNYEVNVCVIPVARIIRKLRGFACRPVARPTTHAREVRVSCLVNLSCGDNAPSFVGLAPRTLQLYRCYEPTGAAEFART